MLLLEPLEERVLLAATASLVNGVPTITGDDAVDNLTLRASTSGVLEYSYTGSTGVFSSDFDPNAPGNQQFVINGNSQINLNLNGGDDSVSIDTSLQGRVSSTGSRVTINSGDGNDSVSGPAQNNTWSLSGDGSGTLNGNIQFSGINTLTGGSSNDTYQFATGNNLGAISIDETAGGLDSLDFRGTSKTVTVDLSASSQQTVTDTLKLTVVDGDSIENLFGGNADDKLTGNALGNLIIGGPGNDTLKGKQGDDRYVFDQGAGTDTVSEDSGAKSGEGSDTLDFTAVTANLNVVVKDVGSFTVAGSGSVTATGSEKLLLGAGSNVLDYTNYASGVSVDLLNGDATAFESVSGIQHVTGSQFADSLIGDARSNTLKGNGGDDRIRGNGGADSIDAGTGTDTLSEVRDVNFTLTNTTLTATGSGITGTEVDTLASFESAVLIGGASNNTLDASAFSGPVTLDGGSSVSLALLNNGVGVRATNAQTISLTGKESTTLLSSLNGGDGIASVAGNDFRIKLTDGKTIDVDIAGAVTLQDLITRIQQAANSQASGRLTVGLDSDSGESLLFTDSLAGTEDLSIEPLNGSPTAEQLGLTAVGLDRCCIACR